jgi:carbonic anhydrase
MPCPRTTVALVAAALCLAAAGARAEESHPHFTYGGAHGPDHWAALDPEFKACGTGHEQSPIDIKSSEAKVAADLPAIAFSYQPTPLKIIDNGHSIQVNLAPGNYITIAGHRYDLLQFHFHHPSEESIDGKHQPMVAHLVHRDTDGHLAVVAVLLMSGPVNPMVATLWENLPAQKEKEVEVPGVQVNPAELLPSARGYYTFAGSLTTPPCSEGVTWYVLKQPSTLSQAEIARFVKAYPNDARPVQPLNGRVVRASP